MIYYFGCEKCKKEYEIDIPMKDYDKEKGNQKCPDCGNKIERVLKPIGEPIYNCGGFYVKP